MIKYKERKNPQKKIILKPKSMKKIEKLWKNETKKKSENKNVD